MNEHIADQDFQSRAPQQPPQGNYHIEATESLVERTLRSLKHNDLFAVFDQQGNFSGGPDGPDVGLELIRRGWASRSSPKTPGRS